jgi:hypothetical protein
MRPNVDRPQATMWLYFSIQERQSDVWAADVSRA